MESGMQLVADACLLVDVNLEGISSLCHSVQRVFEELGITATLSPQSHHVSIGYTMGSINIDHLVDVAREIAEQPLTLAFSGIEILRGQTTDKDYVVLRVAHNPEIEYAISLITENAPTRTFGDGFQAHLTLLTIERDSVSDCEVLARYLELKVLGLIGDIKLAIDGISIFGNGRQRLAQIPFPHAI
jgi:hypothetical protein